MPRPRTDEGRPAASSPQTGLWGFDHVADRQVAECHRRGERQAGLIADSVLSCGRDIAGSVEPGNGMAPLMNDLAAAVDPQSDGRRTGRMQFDPIERRLLDRTEAGIGATRRFRSSKFPLVLAAMEVFIEAGLREAVKTLNLIDQAIAVDPELR